MGKILVEERLLAELFAQIEVLADRVEYFEERSEDKRHIELITNQEMCTMLGVTSRTLVNYRDKGLLPFVKIGQKIFYKPEDVEKSLIKNRK